ncbi:hypothetical protein [Salinicoccus sp. CNSTN-B1]
MDVLSAIKNRRSTPKLKEAPVDPKKIEKILEAAVGHRTII